MQQQHQDGSYNMAYGHYYHPGWFAAQQGMFPPPQFFNYTSYPPQSRPWEGSPQAWHHLNYPVQHAFSSAAAAQVSQQHVDNISSHMMYTHGQQSFQHVPRDLSPVNIADIDRSRPHKRQSRWDAPGVAVSPNASFQSPQPSCNRHVSEHTWQVQQDAQTLMDPPQHNNHDDAHRTPTALASPRSHLSSAYFDNIHHVRYHQQHPQHAQDNQRHRHDVQDNFCADKDRRHWGGRGRGNRHNSSFYVQPDLSKGFADVHSKVKYDELPARWPETLPVPTKRASSSHGRKLDAHEDHNVFKRRCSGENGEVSVRIEVLQSIQDETVSLNLSITSASSLQTHNHVIARQYKSQQESAMAAVSGKHEETPVETAEQTPCHTVNSTEGSNSTTHTEHSQEPPPAMTAGLAIETSKGTRQEQVMEQAPSSTAGNTSNSNSHPEDKQTLQQAPDTMGSLCGTAANAGTGPQQGLEEAEKQLQPRAQLPILLFDLNGTLTSHTAVRRSSGITRIRPGVKALARLAHKFRFGIFSSATHRTILDARLLLEAAMGAPLFEPGLILHRDHTVPAPAHHIKSGGKSWDTVKPLSKWFSKLHRVLLFDDDEYKAMPGEKDNHIHMPLWDDRDSSCKVLEALADILEQECGDLGPDDDVRTVSKIITDKLAAVADEAKQQQQSPSKPLDQDATNDTPPAAAAGAGAGAATAQAVAEVAVGREPHDPNSIEI